MGCIVATIRRKPILAINIGLFVISLLLGYGLFHWDVATGDGLWIYKPVVGENAAGYPILYEAEHLQGLHFVQAPWKFVWLWYTNINGRLSQAVSASMFSVFSHISPTPEDFPWWLIRAVGFFCLLAIPLNIVSVTQRLIGLSWRMYWGFILILYSIWTCNIIVLTGPMMNDFNLEASYLPVYLLTCGLLWLSHNPLKKMTWPTWIGFGILYVGLSLFGEQYIASIPFLIATPIVLQRFETHQKTPPSLWLRFITGCLLLSAFAMFIYDVSPGQQWRTQHLNVLPLTSVIHPYHMLQWVYQEFSYSLWGAISCRFIC